MADYGGSPYKIRTTSRDIDDVMSEVNRIFAQLGDRLDKMEGIRGRPELRNVLVSNSDIVVTDSSKGFILKGDGNPANYWRISVESGALAVTNLGPNYI